MGRPGNRLMCFMRLPGRLYIPLPFLPRRRPCNLSLHPVTRASGRSRTERQECAERA
ncbi:RHTO0S07e07646g1_1 [Rhodotorula toruloides]|uniref:RHTO0S07e07646g1_1 n=2 Tax=Rhodotorula toruloides TaxID=5286 RepID=A0A061AZW0_RHOTO|nr:uncharacterized protein RHTO_02994 [Rhodotorula toruloides NP11]EMS25266.1 hypothetical protein RHTO_02994 [Rhodotorula toruloides NP11]CDR43064.1 RHTO0S07e07646g1_1 [Rhodotorula toruloides]